MAAVEVPQTLEYRGGQLNAAPVLEVENFTNWKKRFMCHIIGIEPQFENIIKNGPFVPMTAGQRKPENQWTGDERKAANLDQRLKSLIMSVLPDDQMNSVINCLTAKSTWDDLILYHEGPSDVKESRVMDLKLCYNTFKFKEGESLTQTFTRYKALMNELVNDGIKLSKLEINTGFINGLPKKWLSFCQSLRNTNNVKDSKLASLFGKLKYEENLIDSIYETENNKSLVFTTPLSIAFFSSSIAQDFQDNPDDEEDTRSSHEYLNDLEEEYQARALLAKSKRFFKKEDVSSDDNEMVEVKVLMELAEENDVFSKEGARNGKCVKISMRKCISEQIPSQKKRILGVDQLTKHSSSLGLKDLVFERLWFSEAEGFILPNHDTGRILQSESQRNTTDPSVVVTDSSATDYDSADGSLVCSTPLPLLKKLDGVEPISGPKTIKSILRSKSTFKAKALKSFIINEPSLAPAKANDTKVTKPGVERPWLSKAEGFILPNHDTADESSVCSTPLPPLKKLDGVELISRPKTIKSILRSKSTFKAEALKGVIINEPSSAPAKDNKSSSALKCDIKKPIWYMDSRCSRHMTGVKSYLHKYVEQPGPKVVFGDDSTYTTKGYGFIKCNGIVFTKVAFVNGLKYNLISISQLCDAKYIVQFDEKRGTIFNSNKEIVMIDPRERDVYVLNMTSSTQESCFFAKASENLNWLRHKRFAYLNFKTINKLAKQNLVIVYIHNHKDHLGKFDEKADDGYLLGYSLVSKAFRVFNTRRQQTEETYRITFDESPDAIKFSRSSVKTSTLLCCIRKDIHMMNSSTLMKTFSILPNTKDIQISEHLSSPNIEDTLAQNTTIPSPPIPVSSMVTLAPQDRWSQDKHIELVNIIGNLGAGMLTKSMAKQLSAALAHKCLFLDFLSEEEPKKVSEALKHTGWVDAMQDELNQFSRNKANPKESHLIAVKRIFKYLKAMSLAEAEYIAAAGCCANILWMKSQLTDYGIIYEKIIFSKGTLNYIELDFIPTQYQLADIFTKPLDEPTFKRLIVELGMLNTDSKPEASVLTEEN
ncbi:retrovirus-related pol polyprotein from transposon TNT 1-94 [Tanacetum coccineum]